MLAGGEQEMAKEVRDWESRKIEILARVKDLLNTPKASEITIIINCGVDEPDSITYEIKEVG